MFTRVVRFQAVAALSMLSSATLGSALAGLVIPAIVTGVLVVVTWVLWRYVMEAAK